MSRKILLVIAIFCFTIFTQCNIKTKKPLFTIDFGANDIVRENSNCREIFEKVFWIDSLQLNKEPYVESVLNRFIGFNRYQSYERLFLIQMDMEGEVSNRSTFNIQIKNGGASIVKYAYTDGKFTPNTKKIESFNEKAFVDFLNENSLVERQRNYNIMTFDFENSSSCECRFLGHTDFDINDLDNLDLFDQFAN
ncbi:hypothetical protein [Aquimarina algiphila]|uniref:Uncharacterized protein n=1 Tax=Aquimarina algiphila TaxID=2047982 RepID=A0A554VJ47_9FLAO|nr:hypothetical protein [Aquimarina algiphila]TSE07894.1 hypothetical protein FOF46_14300 [Aquimarina algiphila]